MRPSLLKQVINDYKTGKSGPTISRDTGVELTTVYKCLKAEGVRIRNFKEANAAAFEEKPPSFSKVNVQVHSQIVLYVTGLNAVSWGAQQEGLFHSGFSK